MTPVAAAVLPHPPLLVPELAGAAAPELDMLRAACRNALAAVARAAEHTVVVGDGPVWGLPEPSAPGSFRPYGAAVEVALPVLERRSGIDVASGHAAASAGPRQARRAYPTGVLPGLDLPGLPAPARLPELPLSLAVAAHLLAGLDPPPARLSAVTVPASLGPGAAAAVGRALGDQPSGPVGLVVMGDLSACRSDRAPGALRPEAAGFDVSVADALRTGQPKRLLDLDPVLAADLQVAGRVPLQVLAGAFEDGPAVHGRVLYQDAPYGVGYLVALLTVP